MKTKKKKNAKKLVKAKRLEAQEPLIIYTSTSHGTHPNHNEVFLRS
jgi:hypothetical protein